MTDDYLQYYDLESYLFGTVRQRFHKEKGKLNAFDLFSIIIWKSERAKSRLAHRLIKQAGDVEAAAEGLTRDLFKANSSETRLTVVMEVWGFYLPMASAILTVLWPEDFTVYDIRACEQLEELEFGNFANLGNLNTKALWPKYLEYCDAVKRAVPQYPCLRDKDRFLWGRSAARQLVDDIACGFSKPTEPSRELLGPLDQQCPTA